MRTRATRTRINALIPGTTRAFWYFFMAITTVRGLVLLTSPLELAPDEAYYWDWSRHLSFGYYSKPPLIAWTIWLGTHILGHTELGVRFPALVMGTLSLYFLYSVAKKIKGPEIAFWAVLLSGLTVGASVGAYIMTIDAPLIFFWTLSLATTWQALTASRQHAPMWWVLSGAFVGLGLLSKQTMVAFPLFLFLFMLCDGGNRHHLRRPWPYIAMLIALLSTVPTLVWNMHHGWITLLHTKHHFDPNRHGGLEGLKTFFQLVGSLFGVLTPLTFCLIIGATAWSFKGVTRLDPGDRFLFFLGPLPLALILLLAFHQKVNPNWPAPFFVTSTVLAASWGLKHAKRLTVASTVAGATMVAILYISPYVIAKLPVYGGKFDPFLRLRGWKELGMHLTDIIQKEGHPQGAGYVLALPRQVVSELAFYMAGQPRVYMWKAGQHVKSQYDLWESPLSRKEPFSAILVKPDKKRLRPPEIYLFKSITPIRHIKLRGLPPDRGGYWVYKGEYDPGTR